MNTQNIHDWCAWKCNYIPKLNEMSFSTTNRETKNQLLCIFIKCKSFWLIWLLLLLFRRADEQSMHGMMEWICNIVECIYHFRFVNKNCADKWVCVCVDVDYVWLCFYIVAVLTDSAKSVSFCSFLYWCAFFAID